MFNHIKAMVLLMHHC